MATVRQSITALYEQSRKSIGEAPAMMAVIESEAAAPAESEFAIPTIDAKPSIARRFEDLKQLAEREVAEETCLPDERGDDDSAITPASFVTDDPITMMGQSVTDIEEEGLEGEDVEQGRVEGVEAAGEPTDVVSGASAHLPDADPTEGAADPDMPSVDNTPPDSTPSNLPLPDRSASDLPSSDLVLPSEPPAPATGDALSDLDVADIQELVRQAWDDEIAVGRPSRPLDEPGPGERPDIEDHPDDDSDIEAAMEEIAAAVVQSGETATLDVASMRAELVDAMRAELQALLASDIRPMIKSAIAEALQTQPTPEPGTDAGTITSGTAKKKTATKKTVAKRTVAKKATSRKKAAGKKTSKEATATPAKTAASAKKSDD